MLAHDNKENKKMNAIYDAKCIRVNRLSHPSSMVQAVKDICYGSQIEIPRIFIFG